MEKRVNRTNREFATTSVVFRNACALANVEPTPREASKFRLGRGEAFAALRATSGRVLGSVNLSHFPR